MGARRYRPTNRQQLDLSIVDSLATSITVCHKNCELIVCSGPSARLVRRPADVLVRPGRQELGPGQIHNHNFLVTERHSATHNALLLANALLFELSAHIQ